MAASNVYYNFSADCVNSNYTGFSSRIPYMSLTSGFIGSSFNFANIFDDTNVNEWIKSGTTEATTC